MDKIITREIFLNIFKRKEYRNKLDKIVLNFFDLDTTKRINYKNIKKETIVLKFILMINTEEVLNILVEDTKKLFQSSKTFYINISFREVEKYHELLIPCYWEIYAPFSYKNLKKKPKIYLLAALLCCKDKEEIEKILKELECFTMKNIQNILKIIP